MSGAPRPLANVSLEISAKPFVKIDDPSVYGVLADVFRHWYSLLKHADQVSLLWWLSDGTDILQYNRNMDAEIEWMYWLGFAHKTYDVPREKDPEGESIVGRPRIYRPDMPRLAYHDVRRIVGLMKRAARETLGRDLRVGVAFDPGAEFSNAPFRYKDHPELLLGDTIKCIDCTARLHADPRPFAGFPAGLPEGLPFGTFFGRQSRLYMADMGFDYLWLSNSFGFGRSPYAFGGAGQFFDGERYRPDGNTRVRDAVLEYWRLFRAENPDFGVECRGTDFTLGMNLVNHATPYAAMYNGGFNFTPPPNTPWPALTSNHGLALCGYLSQISGYRGDRVPFRFYATDPWWCNSPWMDRWERQPHDIYLSTSVTRVDEQASVQAFNDVKFLSIDTSWGEVPEQIPDEIIPHVKRALTYRPDDTPPVVWVYPFAEYDRYTFEQTARIAEVMCGDLLIQNAFNHGLPMSGVVTTDAFVASRRVRPGRYAGRVLVTPVPEAGSAWEDALLDHLATGGAVLCYGPTDHAGPRWLAALNLRLDPPVSGDLALRVTGDADRFLEGAASVTCRHLPALSAGGIRETCEFIDEGTHVLATVAAAEGKRVAALWRERPEWRGGRVAWVRGTSSVSVEGLRGRSLKTYDPAAVYPCETLFRHALGALGWETAIERRAPREASTHLMISRCRNAFMYAGFSPDASVVYRLRTPVGAPILPGRTTRLEDRRARVPVNGWFHEEVRVFVEQADGEVALRAVSPKHFRYRRRWALTGLKNATVRFFPETGCEGHTSVLLNSDPNYFVVGEPYEHAWVDGPLGRHLEMRDITGTVTFAWTRDDDVEPVLPNVEH